MQTVNHQVNVNELLDDASVVTLEDVARVVMKYAKANGVSEETALKMACMKIEELYSK